ncbi:MAG: Maf family protein [Armatimonadota bacterium]|nr:Maf family protein [Armatimonadota bacterium]
MKSRRIILASASPRRRELLGLICPEFEVGPSDFDESRISSELPPAEYVAVSARRKARAVASGLDNAIVIGADTIVVVGGEILGKPSDTDDARRMLRIISGRTHQVYTGLCVIEIRNGTTIEKSGIESTDVTVRRLTDSMIERYLTTGEPMDKAGAYAIQGKGAVLIERIKGCYFNVVGLPIYLLSLLLEELGMEVFDCH